MSSHTWEHYDENEYFITFLKIHPRLPYCNSIYSQKKLQFQIQLLNNFKKEKINIEQLRESYKIIIEKELEKKIILGNMQMIHTQEINNIKNDYNTIIIDMFDLYIHDE